MVQYLQNFYREKSVVPYEVLGVKVKYLSLNQDCRHTSKCSLPCATTANTLGCTGSCNQTETHNLELQIDNTSQKNEVCNIDEREIGKSKQREEILLTLREKKIARKGAEIELKRNGASQKYKEKYEERGTNEQRESGLRKCKEQRTTKKETKSKKQGENRLRKCIEQKLQIKET